MITKVAGCDYHRQAVNDARPRDEIILEYDSEWDGLVVRTTKNKEKLGYVPKDVLKENKDWRDWNERKGRITKVCSYDWIAHNIAYIDF